MKKIRFNELKEKSLEKFNELKEKNSDSVKTTEEELTDFEQLDDSYLNSPSMKYFDEPERYEPAGLDVPKEELYAMEDPYGPVNRNNRNDRDDRVEESRPKKGKKKKKRRKKHPAIKLLIVFVVIAGLYLHLSSDLFNVNKIEVVGNDLYTKKQIVAMTDFEIGKNIFISRLGKSTDAIMEDPYFEKVSIRRDLPSGITIEVKERKAVGAISRNGKSSNYVIVDRKGVVLADNSKSKKDKKNKTLTQVKGLKIKEAVQGEKLKVTDDEIKKEALKLLNGIADTGLKISDIEINDSEVKLYIDDEFYIKGTYKNVQPIIESGGLKNVIKQLEDDGYSRGTIMVGNNEYVAFSKKLK